MKKATFTFPSYDSLWLFTQQVKAINIRVEPKKNLLSGLFDTNEINTAIKDFNAVEQIRDCELNTISEASKSNSIKRTLYQRSNPKQHCMHLSQKLKFLISHLHL